MDNVGSAACGIASDQAHQGLRQLDELGPSALSSLMGYLSRSWDPAPIQDLDAPARRNLQQQRVRYAALDLQEPIEKIARQTQGRGPTEHFRNIVELINVRDSARLRQLLAQRRTDDVHVRDLQRATPEARCFSMQLGLLLQQLCTIWLAPHAPERKVWQAEWQDALRNHFAGLWECSGEHDLLILDQCVAPADANFSYLLASSDELRCWWISNIEDLPTDIAREWRLPLGNQACLARMRAFAAWYCAEPERLAPLHDDPADLHGAASDLVSLIATRELVDRWVVWTSANWKPQLGA